MTAKDEKTAKEPEAKQADVSPTPVLDNHHGEGGVYVLEKDGTRKKATKEDKAE